MLTSSQPRDPRDKTILNEFFSMFGGEWHDCEVWGRMGEWREGDGQDADLEENVWKP